MWIYASIESNSVVVLLYSNTSFLCVCVCVMQAHNEEHSLQRGGSVSHRRAQSDCLQNRLPITQHFGKVRSVSKQSHIYFKYLWNWNRRNPHPYHYLIHLFYCPILLLCAVLHLLLLTFCRFIVIHPDICHLYWGNVALLSLCFVTPCCLMSVTSPSACSQT